MQTRRLQDVNWIPAEPGQATELVDKEAGRLPDGWKERPQLHRQADVPADLESARHGDGWSTQLALQNLDAILSRHREQDVRVRMHPLFDLTGPFPDRENILPALRAAQIELIDRIEIFGGI